MNRVRGAAAESILCTVALCVAAAAQSTPLQPRGRIDWSPGLATAFDAYDAGRYADTSRLCEEIRRSTSDRRLALDAQALHAMALLRMPSRPDRMTGRVALSQLSEAEPGLLARPECRLAYGIAQRELAESPDAILSLTMARDAFAGRGDHLRAATAAVELARAWMRHGEWDTPIQGYPTERPEDPQAADALRVTRIRAIRDGFSPDSSLEFARREIDRLILEIDMRRGAEPESVQERLGALAAARPVDAVAAWALLELGGRHESAGDWEGAEQCYVLARRSMAAADVEAAEQALRRLQQPSLSLDAPARSALGESPVLRVSVRNLTSVGVELRRLDLDAWIRSERGDISPDSLPVSGAIVFESTQTVSDPAGRRGWNRSVAVPQPLEPGAYVAIAACVEDGIPHSSKRLMLVNRAELFCLSDGRTLGFWLCAPDGGGLPAEAHGALRVSGSPAEREVLFRNGIALMPIPPEARTLRNGRWICTARVDGELLFTMGPLPAVATLDAPPGALLFSSPTSPVVGENIRVVGLMRHSSAESLRTPVTIELANIDDAVVASRSAPVDPAGIFSAEFRTANLPPGRLRVVARIGDRVLDATPIQTPVTLKSESPPIDLRLEIQDRPGESRDSISGRISATYRWGVPLAGAEAMNRYHTSRLPDEPPNDAMYTSLAFHDDYHLDHAGEAPFVTDLSHRNMPPGPLAIGVLTELKGWDERITPVLAAALHEGGPAKVWIGAPETAACGETYPLVAGWFDPRSLAIDRVRLFETDPSGETRRLDSRPAPIGMLVDEWSPRVAGVHTLTAWLSLADCSEAVARRAVTVSSGPAASALRIAAAQMHSGFKRLRVRLEGVVQRPALLAVEQGPLLALHSVSPTDGDEIEIPLPNETIARPTVHLLGDEAGELRSLDRLLADSEEAVELALATDSTIVPPGSAAQVRLTAVRRTSNPAPVAYIARLIPSFSLGSLRWGDEPGAAAFAEQPAQLSAFRTGLAERGPNDAIACGSLDPRLTTAFFEEATLWEEHGLLRPEMTLRVPVPAEHGRYRVVVAAVSHSTLLATAALEFEVRSDLELSLECPEQLEVGDRLPVVLRMRNTTDHAIAANVDFETGRPLELAPGATGAATGTQEIPPHSTCYVSYSVEASRPGRGVMRAVVNAAARQTASATYRVTETTAPRPEEAPAIRVRRSVYRLSPEDAADPKVRENIESAPRIPVVPGDTLPPGTVLLVEDQVELARPAATLEWRQWAPANCFTLAGNGQRLTSITPAGQLALQDASFRGNGLETGHYRHVSGFVSVRPGVCFLPPPIARIDGRPAPLSVLPADAFRLRVE